MPKLIPEMWKRSTNQTWYVTIGGEQINLGRDKRTAERVYTQLVRKHGLIQPGHTDCTLHDLVDAYLDWAEDNWAPTTFVSRQHRFLPLKHTFNPSFKAVALTPPLLRKHLKATLSGQGQKKPSPTTVHDTIHRINQMYNWGIRNGWVSVNPVTNCDKPAPRIRELYLTDKQFHNVLNAIRDNEPFYYFVLFMRVCGCRAMEMFKLTADHFYDLDGKEPKIIFDARESKRGRTRRRIVYLQPDTAAMARSLVKRFPDGPVFNDKKGRPYKASTIGREFRALGKTVGISGLCATVLRHSYAHSRIVKGQPIEVVAKLMGHSSTQQIYQRYGHLDNAAFLAEQAKQYSEPFPRSKP